MRTPLRERIIAWAEAVFLQPSMEEALYAQADITRWAWLPALSGVSVGAEHARLAAAASPAPVQAPTVSGAAEMLGAPGVLGSAGVLGAHGTVRVENA